MSFYDDEMLAMAAVALTYLLSERGQEEIRKSNERCKEVAALLAKSRDIPWDKLHEPFTI